MSAMTSSHLTPAHIACRIVASLAGGYVFVWGFTVLTIALGVATGMAYDEVRMLAYLLAFLIFLTAFCWAFVEQSLARVWVVLAGGGSAMTALAWLMTR